MHKHTNVGFLQCFQHRLWRDTHRPRPKFLQQQPGNLRSSFLQRFFQAGSHFPARLIRNQRHALLRAHTQAHVHSVLRARHQLNRYDPKGHSYYFT